MPSEKGTEEMSGFPLDLDGLYLWAEEMMWAGRLVEIDHALAKAEIKDLSDDILIGLLTATLPVRSKLPSRKRFCEDVERTIKERGTWENGLLVGLE